MDFAELNSLKPSDFVDAANGYRTTGDMASEAKDSLENQITADMRKYLEGEAAEAADRQLRELAKDFHYMQAECGLVSTALRAFASDISVAKKKLDGAIEDARAQGFTVRSDGSVSYPAAGKEVDGKLPAGSTVQGATDETARAIQQQAGNIDPNPNRARAYKIADQIATALKEATEVDAKWASKLRGLKADDDLTVSEQDWADVKKDMDSIRQGAKDYLAHIKPPPKGDDPEANAEWWKGRSEQGKADYVSMYPDAIGAMDGLPATVRDEANRVVFDEKHAQYQLQLDAIPKEPPKFGDIRRAARGMGPSDEWNAWNDKYAERRQQLQSALHGMEAIQKRFDSTGGKDGLPEAYLLAFDPEGDGRVVLATGNPDTADHTAMYVPGTKTHLGSINGDLNRGATLWRQSHRLDPDAKISTITWFNYDAPDDIPHAIRPGYAEEGGPTLREFLDGARAAHQQATGSTAHTTVIGHSYGSTVVGEAARGHWPDGALAADDVIAVGSPGMRAKHAIDLGIKPDHMWAEKAGDTFSDDWFVREGGRYVGLGKDFTIPTDKEFGSIVMKSDAEGHSDYWNVGKDGDDPSESVKNQARVIVGDYKGVTRE
ncbi:alpha/beta hydrolase [Streptomyces sp. NPDC052396]|uniref:alpha/beta hydrolase n=1 Tax=Streptomyces sp. NPDC052396 TaxID=3365689 RepID=UPI0037D048A3